MKTNFSISLFLFLIAVVSSAQETERALPFNYVQSAQNAMERNFSPREQRGGGSVELPFFDDFSRYSVPTNNPDVPVEWQRWTDDDVYINDALPISPMSIGVATLDGLASNGCPYDFSDPNSYGPADSLSSIEIDLSGYDANSNIQLMFYYQPGGIGNAPEFEDSLVLEFYSPFGQGQWIQKWSVPGDDQGTESFQKVIIPVVEPEFLLDGFRFRFRNYATLSAWADHWHIDYVVMDQNFDYTDCNYDDVAMTAEVNSLLEEYTAMPWTHFIDNPASFMKQDLQFTQRNLGPTANIVTGFSTQYEDLHWDFPTLDFNTSGNECSEYSRTFGMDNYEYDNTLTDTSAVFDVKVYCTTTDGTPQNDTARFQQVFTNYYAYDDGTAERAYAVNTTGGKVAVKFFAEEPDSLLGMFMYWIPFVEDVSDQTFLLRAWNDGGGEPGSEIGENYTFYSPEYYCTDYNIFGYYAYDQPLFVDGNFYVGWVQDNNSELNIGNDKNGTSNQTKLFYQHGGTTDWNLSIISGSVMIRPVFKSGLSEVWNLVNEQEQEGFTVFPNPAENMLTIVAPENFEPSSFRIFDLSGKEISANMFTGNVVSHDISNLSDGMYTIALTGNNGEQRFQKFIKH